MPTSKSTSTDLWYLFLESCPELHTPYSIQFPFPSFGDLEREVDRRADSEAEGGSPALLWISPLLATLSSIPLNERSWSCHISFLFSTKRWEREGIEGRISRRSSAEWRMEVLSQISNYCCFNAEVQVCLTLYYSVDWSDDDGTQRPVLAPYHMEHHKKHFKALFKHHSLLNTRQISSYTLFVLVLMVEDQLRFRFRISFDRRLAAFYFLLRQKRRVSMPDCRRNAAPKAVRKIRHWLTSKYNNIKGL